MEHEPRMRRSNDSSSCAAICAAEQAAPHAAMGNGVYVGMSCHRRGLLDGLGVSGKDVGVSGSEF